MNFDKTQARQRVGELAQNMLPSGNVVGFFDTVYATANGDANAVPWANLQPHPISRTWLEQHHISGVGQRALVVGCGLGDDAEDLAKRGFRVTAFDISPHAIAWCQQRFPNSPVTYRVADLLTAPTGWEQAFDFVLEIYTIQSMPIPLHTQAIANIANFVAPGGKLLVVCRGRDQEENLGTVPWPLTSDELDTFQLAGLREVSLKDVRDEDGRHFRVVYER